MQSVVAALLVVLALPAAAAIGQGPRPGLSAANAQGAAPSRPPLPGLARRTPFTNFGARPVLELRGDSGTATVDFGSRADELVTKATFHIRYAYSPDLVPGQSHIRLTLNGEVIGILPVTAEDAGKTVTRDVEVNPSLIVGFNKLVLSLVAPRAAGPAESARPGPWADVSGSSELEVGTQPLAVADAWPCCRSRSSTGATRGACCCPSSSARSLRGRRFARPRRSPPGSGTLPLGAARAFRRAWARRRPATRSRSPPTTSARPSSARLRRWPAP